MRPLADKKNPPAGDETPVQSPKMATAQRAKFWGTLLIILASLATVTFCIRSRPSQTWFDDDQLGPVIGIVGGFRFLQLGLSRIGIV